MSAVIPDPALTDWVPLGGVGGGGSMIALQEVVVPAGGAASIDFQNIPQGYADLLVRGYVRCDHGVPQVGWLRFNGDAGANYDYQTVVAQGSAIAAQSQAGSPGIYAAFVAPTATTAGTASVFETLIAGYANTVWRKHATSHFGLDDQAAGVGNTYLSGTGSWRTLAAINRVQIAPGGGTLVAGSRATLYGIAAPVTTLPLSGVRAVWGRINGTNGAILSGTGFSCVRTATGQYTITFNTPFASAPTVVPAFAGFVSSGGVAACKAAPTTSSVQITTVNSAFAYTDLDFNFIAMEAA